VSKPAVPEYHDVQTHVWQAGAAAARQGKPASDNPHPPLRYEFVSWHNGWAFAAHLQAKEDDEL
jgi:hypothetical protein